MLLHVLAQVGLLRVALAAVLADVRLEVFAFLVLGDVLQEGRFVAETLVAGVALVGLVGLVAPRVRLEVAELGEGLLTPRMPAPETERADLEKNLSNSRCMTLKRVLRGTVLRSS